MVNGMSPRKPIQAPRTVVLIGLMGAGKTCIGRRLASRLALKFVDADDEIEAAAGCSVEEMFERHGESAFRDGERRVIASLMATPVHVLSTGGGAFMDPRTREAIHERAISIWLRAELDLLLKRTARRNDRPLLKEGDPKEILENLMTERHPLYDTADIVVDSTDDPPEVIVERALSALRQHIQEYGIARVEEARVEETPPPPGAGR